MPTGFTLSFGAYADPSFVGMKGILRLSAPLVSVSTGDVVQRSWTVTIAADGTASVASLPYNDDPAFTPTGTVYTLAWQALSYKDSPQNKTFQVLRAEGTTIDYDLIANIDGTVTPSVSPQVPLVTSVNGRTGTVTLTASDVGAAPAGSTGAVASVNTKTGAVVLSASDVGADASGAATAAQAFAVQRANHTGTQAATTITGLSTVATSGAYTDLSGKPTVPTVGAAGAGAGVALSSTDASVTNARTPTAHAASHAAGGSDPVTAASIGGTPILTPTATKTAAYTAVVGDLAMMNVAGGATVLTLPTAPANKAQVGYRAIGATIAVPLTVNRGGSDTIGTTGATSATVPLADEVSVLQYDAPNTRWLGVANVKTQASLDSRYDAAGAASAVSSLRFAQPTPAVGEFVVHSAATVGTFTAANGDLRVAPIWLPAGTYDQAVFQLNSAGSTGALMKVVGYLDNTTTPGRPGTLVIETATVDATTSGVKQVTLPTPIVIPAGGALLWAGTVIQGAPTTVPVAHCVTRGSMQATYTSAYLSTLFANVSLVYQTTGVTGAAPANSGTTMADAHTRLGFRRSA